MKPIRFKTLPLWCAGVYFCWSALVYFGSLGSESHCWWPIFLDPLIFPLGLIEDRFLQPALMSWLAPDPTTAPESTWMFLDSIGGAYYIAGGTVWFWTVGKVCSFVSTRLWPQQPSAVENPAP